MWEVSECSMNFNTVHIPARKANSGSHFYFSFNNVLGTLITARVRDIIVSPKIELMAKDPETGLSRVETFFDVPLDVWFLATIFNRKKWVVVGNLKEKVFA
jgi:hypothetical protein